ncbi:conserved protein of unknown function [Modestobacter italicus]|uniref:Uncharacterized protein n=1 Tax=Modestobacter italicus (strain DSM 44449 / CECT 9708 / BC 501) TaxID=2732864 RepID=I4EVM6_MODI5|nr:conserved protein of unknown function [Modestobacter marinus]
MGAHVTWETCPGCGRPAALGWLDGDPVQFDCPRGCRLPPDLISAMFGRRRPVRRSVR